MGTFVRSKNTTNKIMRNLLIALFPIILYSIYKNGYIPYSDGTISFIEIIMPLINILIGCLVTTFIEFIYALITKKGNWKIYLKNSYPFFPGLLLALLLPTNCPIYVLLLGSFISSVTKVIFESLGKNILNSTLLGYLVLLLIFPNFLNITTPLTNSFSIIGIGNYDLLIKPYGSLLDFFIGNIPGIVTQTCALIGIISFTFLVLTKSIKWRVTLSYICSVFIITFVIARFLEQGIYYPLFHILSGNLIFGAIFLATNQETSCVTPTGQVLQGILLGVLTVVFRFIGFEGVVISILIMNLFVSLLDKICATARFNFIKSITYFFIACIIIIVSSMALAATKHVDDNIDTAINKFETLNLV